jgi:hypothetical protein
MFKLTKEDFKEAGKKALQEGFKGAIQEVKDVKIEDDLIKIPEEIAYNVLDPRKIRQEINERLAGTTHEMQLNRIRERMFRNEVIRTRLRSPASLLQDDVIPPTVIRTRLRPPPSLVQDEVIPPTVVRRRLREPPTLVRGLRTPPTFLQPVK